MPSGIKINELPRAAQVSGSNLIAVESPAGTGTEAATVEQLRDYVAHDALEAISEAAEDAVEAVEEKGAETLASIPEDYTKITGDVADLKSALKDEDKYLQNIVYAGKVSAGTGWRIGTLRNGVYDPSVLYRVSTPEIQTAYYDTVITPANGYQFGIATFSNGVFVSQTGWRRVAQTIPAGTQYKLVIGKNPEDSTITADIDTFVDALFVDNWLENVNGDKSAIHALNGSDSSMARGFINTSGELIVGATVETLVERTTDYIHLYPGETLHMLCAVALDAIGSGSFYRRSALYNASKEFQSLIWTDWTVTHVGNYDVDKLEYTAQNECYVRTSLATYGDFILRYWSDKHPYTTSKMLADINDILNVQTRQQATVTTSTIFTKYNVFQGLTLKAGHTYEIQGDVSTQPDPSINWYFHIYDSENNAIGNKTIEGRKHGTYVFTPSTDYSDCRITVSYGDGNTHVIACTLNELGYRDNISKETAEKLIHMQNPKECELIYHAGGYSGVYLIDTFNNAMYNVVNNKGKNLEIDVRWSADDVMVMFHNDTFVYNGVTYNTLETNYDIMELAGIDRFEPLVAESKRFGFKITVDLGGHKWSDARLAQLVALLEKYGIYDSCYFTSSQLPVLEYFCRHNNTSNIGWILFARPAINGEMLYLRYRTTGQYCIYIQYDQFDDWDSEGGGWDYVQQIRAHNMVFGVHTPRGEELIKTWAERCDWLVIDDVTAVDYIKTWDFES